MAITTNANKTYNIITEVQQRTSSTKPVPIMDLSCAIEARERVIHEDVIPDGTVDRAYSVGNITTVKALILALDPSYIGYIKIKLNGSATELTYGDVDKEEPGGLFLLFPTAITSLTISNDSGESAKIEMHLLGN